MYKRPLILKLKSTVMKKQLFTFCLLIACTLIFSSKTFAQRGAGGSSDGTGDGSGTTVTPPPPPDIVFNLGSAGVIDIPSTSPYYSLITSVLTALHVTINADGTLTFPTTTCYSGSVFALYCTGHINYTCWKTACKNVPAGCH